MHGTFCHCNTARYPRPIGQSDLGLDDKGIVSHITLIMKIIIVLDCSFAQLVGKNWQGVLSIDGCYRGKQQQQQKNSIDCFVNTKSKHLLLQFKQPQSQAESLCHYQKLFCTESALPGCLVFLGMGWELPHSLCEMHTRLL